MLALPIARRELLVLARAATTWKHRLLSSAAVFGFGIVFALIYHYAGQMVLNQAMRFLGVGLSLMCLFAGASLTADSIAEEKREGTLGLLFLTNLSPFEIVLGKLVAHAVVGFYTVLCALPLLSMSMIFGGMPLGDVLLYVISALNLLFFSAGVGLVASSICRDKKRANTLGSLIVLSFWMGMPLLALGLSSIGVPVWLTDAIGRLSVNLPHSFGIGFASLRPFTPTAWNLGWPHLLGWMLIGLTVWALPRHWQDQPPRQRRLLRDISKAISLGRPAARLKLRRRLLDRNAFMWLASRDRLQAAGAWLIFFSLMAIIGVNIYIGSGRLDLGLLIGIGIALSAGLQLAFSRAAGAQLLREYEQGTLELLLSTPLSAPEVLQGQFAAARRQYRTLFALTFLLLWTGIILLAQQGGRRQFGIASLAVYSGLFLLNFYAIGWVGMWAIMKAPDPKKASSNAFIFITILPGMIFGLIVSCGQFLNWLTGMRLSPGPELLLPLLFTLAFANCIYWLRRAKRELPQELRLFAFRRYTAQERLTLFGQLGRFAGRLLHRARAPRKKILLNSP